MLRRRVSDDMLLKAILENPGATDSEIGVILNLSRIQVSRRKNTEQFTKLTNDFYSSSFKALRYGLAKAVRRLCKAVDSTDERIALRASEIILNKVPLPKESQEDPNRTVLMIGNMIKRLEERKRISEERERTDPPHDMSIAARNS